MHAGNILIYGSPFWAQKGTFFKCSDKNESFYLQKVCFSDREKFSEPYCLHPKIGKTQHNALYESRWKTQHNAFLWVALWGGN
ncbi:PF11689 family protein [Leptospira interrogans serovar Pyrogenes str. 2006006960]|nr:PF11689 family protein [Leptospira interrogans serovar Pyrogenes str. 2006006960]